MLWTLLACGGDTTGAASPEAALLGPSKTPDGTVVVVGLDGLDAEVLASLLPSLPTLRRVADEGFFTTYHVPTKPIWSPVIWTSLSSGYPQEVHGVTHWAQPEGGLYRSDDVLTKRIWDVAGESGWASSVIGWPITDPAKPARGLVVSGKWAPGADARMKVDDGFAFPPEVTARAMEFVQPEGWLADRGLKAQMRLTGWHRHPINTDEYFVRAWEGLFDPHAHALSLLYLRGADQLGHLVDPRSRERAFGDKDLGDIGPGWVYAYYRYLDAAVARVIARLDPARDTLVVLSDHGMQLEGTSEDESRHREPAVLMGWGKRARAGAAAPADADMYDVAATLYALVGLPLARDFAGEPVGGLFDLPAAPPPVATYVLDPRGKPYRAEKPAAPLSASDRAATEQLEALGYLDAKGRPATPLSHGASAPEGPPRPHPR